MLVAKAAFSAFTALGMAVDAKLRRAVGIAGAARQTATSVTAGKALRTVGISAAFSAATPVIVAALIARAGSDFAGWPAKSGNHIASAAIRTITVGAAKRHAKTAFVPSLRTEKSLRTIIVGSASHGRAASPWQAVALVRAFKAGRTFSGR